MRLREKLKAYHVLFWVFSHAETADKTAVTDAELYRQRGSLRLLLDVICQEETDFRSVCPPARPPARLAGWLAACAGAEE